MSIINEKIAALLIRHLEGEPDVHQQAEFQAWLQESPLHEQIAREFTDNVALQDNVRALLSRETAWTRVRDSIQQKQLREIHPKRTLSRWLTAAAAIIVLMSVGIYLGSQNSRIQKITKNNKHLPADIEPGRNGAILTLADGSRVVLDSLGNGLIAQQSGSKVVLQNGQLTYDVSGQAAAGTAYNTMTTPKGRQFNFVLHDGTHVWLNAASSIRYPTVFTGKERLVEIHGEAYFEVAKNTNMPFRVNVANKTEVEVLGTHFNVNAYENERAIYTTLLEGSVKVMAGNSGMPADQQKRPAKAVILQPGDQARLRVGQNTVHELEIINNADVDKVVTWKNGLFDFNNVELDEMMRQLERWYDIEVTYESTVPDVRLRGKMTRDVTLMGLLKNLERLGVHCRLKERSLVVYP